LNAANFNGEIVRSKVERKLGGEPDALDLVHDSGVSSPSASCVGRPRQFEMLRAVSDVSASG
jgi:hypothetical protein